MKNLVLVLLCVVAVNARWSVNYGAKADGDELDWWEHGVFYQVSSFVSDVFRQVVNLINVLRSTHARSKTATAMESETFKVSLTTWGT